MSPTRRQFLLGLRSAMKDMKPPFLRLKSQLLGAYRQGGTVGIRQVYDRLWEDVAHQRGNLIVNHAEATAKRRAEVIAIETHRRYPHVMFPPRSPSIATSAIHKVRQLHYVNEKIQSNTWKRDEWMKKFFLGNLAVWLDRWRQSRTLRAEASERGGLPRRKIDPKFKKIAYPWGDETDISEEQVVERALDTFVVARGEYFAMAGLTDVVRAVDQAASQIASGGIPEIIGWKWELSSIHQCCDKCDQIAEFDAGHPGGPGVYWDSIFPQSHPNCVCSMEPVWADDDEAGDPDWSAPQPPDDYEDRVRGLMDTIGIEFLEAA